MASLKTIHKPKNWSTELLVVSWPLMPLVSGSSTGVGAGAVSSTRGFTRGMRSTKTWRPGSPNIVEWRTGGPVNSRMRPRREHNWRWGILRLHRSAVVAAAAAPLRATDTAPLLDSRRLLMRAVNKSRNESETLMWNSIVLLLSTNRNYFRVTFMIHWKWVGTVSFTWPKTK